MPDTTPEKPEAPAAPIPEPKCFVTTHEGVFNDKKLAYTVTAGETYLKDADGKPRASLFTFAYVKTDAAGTRPVTFLFNGGPGSSSLWLHMGGIGPKRVIVPSDAEPAGTGPYPVADNPLSILDATDIVFIDPVGTGFSRPLGEAKQEEFWGLDADAESIGQFITQWLTTHKRWGSPRYIGGESYGTTRSVAVAAKLHGGMNGVAVNGLALISVILDFHHAKFEKGNPFPDIADLPTFAATALYHGRIHPVPGNRDAFIEEVRRFALDDYLPALLAGSRLDPATRQRVRGKLAGYTGLSETWLERTNLRIDPSRFRKELLRDQGIVLGRFDTRYKGSDHDDVGELPENDPASYGVTSAYVTAMNEYLTGALEVEMDRPYRLRNREANEKWDWLGPKRPGPPSWPGYVNVAPDLGRLQRELPDLKVWMANGRYDLATAFFGVENTVASNGIDGSRVTMTYYDAGHMMYLHEPSLAQLAADFRRFLT